MNFLKLSYIFLCAITISTANANNEMNKPICDPCECNRCDPCSPCCDVPGQPVTSGYNQSPVIDVCNCLDFYSSATFLYIQPMQEQMEYAITVYPTGPLSDNNSKVNKLKFDATPAFKLGLGYNFQYDSWDLFLEYTRIKSSSKSSSSLVEGTVLIDLWSDQKTSFFGFVSGRVSEKWNLNFNIFDLNLGRAFYNGKKLIFKVNCGLKSGFINQKVEIKNFALLNEDLNFFVLVDSDSWLIGPRLGFYSHWLLGKDLRIFGNGAVSMFYQKFNKIHYRESNLLGFPGNEWYMAFNNSLGSLNTSLEGIIGMGYGKYFARNNFHFDISAGYELQLYTDQNMMKNLQSMVLFGGTPVKSSNKPGNLMIHGLNITLQFDY